MHTENGLITDISAVNSDSVIIKYISCGQERQLSISNNEICNPIAVLNSVDCSIFVCIDELNCYRSIEIDSRLILKGLDLN